MPLTGNFHVHYSFTVHALEAQVLVSYMPQIYTHCVCILGMY